MDSEIEARLFNIPPGVEFPMELSHHLKSKLHSVMEQNWHLKRHVDYLDKEVLELRKFKTDLHQETLVETINNSRAMSPDVEVPQSSPLMASKIVELSKKNRDMTAQLESMKTKMRKLMVENEQLRSHPLDEHHEENQSHTDSVVSTKAEEDLVSSSQQLSQITNKMMEYRRQCQQLRIDLKTALRALSQEVGEGVTPQKVLLQAASSSWRGRQQQIITLQQKIADLQIRLTNEQNNKAEIPTNYGFNGEGDNTNAAAFEHIGTKKSCSSLGSERGFSSSASLASSVAPSHRHGLFQQDLKKHEQIGKLSKQLEQMTEDLKNRQQELKASKARTQTLESQTRSFRNQIDLLEGKLREKETESQATWNDMNHLKHELSSLKDRDRRNRDKNGLELQEANRALARERAIVTRLQQVITEKQDALQRIDGEMIELRNKLELCCSSNVQGGINAIERIQYLEMQLLQSSELIAAKEKERQRLVELLNSATCQTEQERQKVIQAQRQSSKVFVVLQQANKCIDDCLDAAQITNASLLQEVEDIRTLMRELKTGDLYSLDREPTGASVKKMKTKIIILSKDIQVLQTNLQELAEARKADLNNYVTLNEQTKNDFLAALNCRPNSKLNLENLKNA